MTFIESSFKELWRNRWLAVSFLVMLILGQFLLQYREDLWPKLYMGIALAAGLLVLFFSRINEPKAIARNTFLIIALLGTANALILPIRQNLDENTHYYFALQFADGKIRVQTDEPNFLMVSPDFLAVTKLPSKPEYKSEYNANLYDKDFLALENIPANYDPQWLNKGNFNNPAYIPSAIGIKIGQLISNKLYVSYYMGRIFNLLFYALLAWLAVKISKNYKQQLFLFATIPYALWITAGFSYDTLYYGLILLIFSQLMNFLVGNAAVTTKRLILYGLTCLGLVFCKPPMIMLAGLPLFLPKRYFAFKNVRLKSFIMAGFVAALGAVWFLQGTIFAVVRNLLGRPEVAGEATVNANRLSYFIQHPLYTVGLFLRSLSDIPATIVHSIEVPQPFFPSALTLSIINLVVFITLFVFVTVTMKEYVPSLIKVILWLMVVAITIAVFYAISGDDRVFSVGDLHIAGVQGRYHYYLLVGLPLLISTKFSTSLEKIGVRTNELDTEKITVLVMKGMLLVSFLNTAVALFGYL